MTTKTKLSSKTDILKEQIKKFSSASVNIMEVCGTHTVSIARSGLKQLIPENIRLLSGPGCPVCVTSTGDIDRVIALSGIPDLQIVTFGDMIHVPGTKSSLEKMRAQGRDVRIVYSPMDIIRFAEKEPDSEFIFVGVGFETTAPSIAATVITAKQKNIKNFSVAPLFKLVPPALKTILDIKERKIDGFILPGHVSTIIGTQSYGFIAEKHHIPCVISGFEPLDILESLCSLLQMIQNKNIEIKNQYVRSVTKNGNETALRLIQTVFRIADSEWRALGKLPDSGLVFQPEFSEFDAFKKFNIPEFPSIEPKGCRCGDILLGLCGPTDCTIFRKKCTPSDPVGPCMVSSEGACAAAYHYGTDSV